MDVAHHLLLEFLSKTVCEHSKLPLLRTYWFDAAIANSLTPEHRAVRDHPYTKLRMGRLDRGVQKGVDALLARDLTALARTKAVATIYLVAGDEDLKEAMVEAQDYGVQVILICVEPSANTRNSDSLLWEADDVIDLDKDTLAPFFSLREPRPEWVPPPLSAPTDGGPLA
jgi:uncharacterized LabA/DUF88 family protein